MYVHMYIDMYVCMCVDERHLELKMERVILTAGSADLFLEYVYVYMCTCTCITYVYM